MQDLIAWFQRRVNENPDYQLPGGYDVEDGRVERDTTGILDHIGRWAPVAGLGFGAGSLLAGGFGAGVGAGTAGATTAGGTGLGVTAGLPAGMSGVGLTGAGAGLAGGTAAAGGVGALSTALGLSPYVMSGINALRGRGASDDEQALSQQQQQLQQMQMARIQQSDPLYQAILRLAMGLMPVTARQALPVPGQAQPRPDQTAPRGY